MDDKNVIKHGLIPYFQKYIDEINLEENNYNLIINNFITLHSVFEAFSFILKSNETREANEHFGKQFQTYRKIHRQEDMSDKEKEKVSQENRTKLAFEEIRPFLKAFVPVLKNKKEELTNYLINENNSDSEIISLI